MTRTPNHSRDTRRVVRSRRSLPALFVAGAALASLAACGGDDDGGGGGGSGGDFSVERALGWLPESTLEDGYQITVGDLDRASELAGVERPDGLDDFDAVFEWYKGISGQFANDDETWPQVAVLPPQATSPDMLQQIEEFEDEVGWTVLDISSFAEIELPPARFTVLQGDFGDAIDAAAGDKDGDVWSVGEGDDFRTDLADRTAARPLGQPLRLAEQDGALAVSKSTPPVEDWLDDEDRLDTEEALVDVAKGLDAHDVYAAMILDGDSLAYSPDLPGGRETPEEVKERIEAEIGQLPVPFLALGAGLTVVDDEAVGVLAYAHRSESDAEENAEILERIFEDGTTFQSRQPVSDLFPDAEITVDGRTVTVTVRFPDDRPPRILWQSLFVRELFVTHA